MRWALFLCLLVSVKVSHAQEQPSFFLKYSPLLKAQFANKNSDSIDLFLAVNSLNFPIEDARILTKHTPSKTIMVRMLKNKIAELAKKPWIQFIDLFIPPKEELTTGSLDISANKVNKAQERYRVNGDQIIASIKENKFDTADMDYKGRIINSEITSPAITTHATIMATILAGAGNSSSFAKGVAYGSNITSSNFANLLPDADSIFQKYKITVQNHSYGTVIQNYYGAEARAYDVNVENNPTLVHVFSSGNTGADAPESGLYSGLTGFANLTGNFKMAKNIITVGATDSFFNIAALSSKGPAYDGRIKPELMAYAEDGTSGAAAMVSGAAVLVQQAYKQQYNSIPGAALTKAVLLNSADDIGNKYVDFFSGYGSLNVYEAVKTINEKRIIEDVIQPRQIRTFSINVPTNIAELKVTLAWTDPAASANAAKVLVNDLDLFVKNVTTGEVWHPWVLSSYPNKDSLSSIAKRGIDTLNNIEQVTIENLAPGIYIITIKGSNITTPNQLFAVAYQMDVADAFEWIFPNATDIIIPNRYNVIRWQTKINQMSRLEFSYNGSDWNLISDAVDLGKQYYKWAVPDTLATAQLRIKLPGPHIYISDSFAICKAANLNVGFNCPDSLLLFWNKLPIYQYQIYYLGNKYLEPFRIVKDTFIVIAKEASPSFNYSVASLINNKAGLRSYTINYENAAVECYFKSFYLQAQNNERNLFAAVIGTLFNVDSISLQKLKDRHFGTIKTLQKLTGISFTFEDSSLTQGLNTYRLQIKLKNGSFIYSNEIKTYHFRDLATIIYPNPSAQGKALNIITDGNNKTNIEIYSSTGALIFGIPLINTLTQLQTYRLPKGIYFVSIITEDGNKSMQKLIVY